MEGKKDLSLLGKKEESALTRLERKVVRLWNAGYNGQEVGKLLSRSPAFISGVICTLRWKSAIYIRPLDRSTKPLPSDAEVEELAKKREENV